MFTILPTVCGGNGFPPKRMNKLCDILYLLHDSLLSLQAIASKTLLVDMNFAVQDWTPCTSLQVSSARPYAKLQN